jgi:predicted nucleic acid-binding protein
LQISARANKGIFRQLRTCAGLLSERLTIVALDGEEYANALQSSAAAGIVGGRIYDAMLAHCALKSKAEPIFTWNARHYGLCGAEVIGRLRRHKGKRWVTSER